MSIAILVSDIRKVQDKRSAVAWRSQEKIAVCRGSSTDVSDMPTMPHHACSPTVSALLDVALQILQACSVQNLVIGCNQQARVKKPSRMITVSMPCFRTLAIWC